MFEHKFLQNNQDFYGYAVFTIDGVRFFTEKDARKVIESQSNPNKVSKENKVDTLTSPLGSDKLSNPFNLDKSGQVSDQSQDTDVTFMDGRDTLIHHHISEFNINCDILNKEKIWTLTDDWSLVSCPECLKYKPKGVDKNVL